MKKSLLLLFVAILTIGVFSFNQEKAKAASGTEGNYRVPVISPLSGDPSGPFYVTRIECTLNIRDPNNPNDDIGTHLGTSGSRFMDISLGGDLDNGAPVYSSGSGTVTFAGNLSSFGDNVVVENSEVGFRYAHLTKIYVWQGEQILKGDLIGLIGNTGYSFGAHLHWEAWQMNNSGFNLMSIPGVNLTDATTGQPCTGSNVGTISGGSRFSWNSCPEFYALARPDVVVFDHKNCRGNYAVLPGNGTFNLATTFNDRTRSIYIPQGKTIVAGADANNPMSLHICHTVDMWNVDTDYYENSTTRVGFNGTADRHGYNMISSVTVLDKTTCQYDATTIGAAAPGNLPLINTNSWDIGGGSGGGAYGDSRIDIRKDTNYGSDQYGWDDPTNGWVNVPANLNDQVSSVRVDSGYSLWVAKDPNGNGTRKCLVSNYPDLSGAYYDNGDPMTDTISSIWAFTDSTCGGNYLGTRPGDTVTFWENANFDWNNWGIHDPYSGSLMSNMISSIGVTPGWSAVVYEGPNLTGGFTCFVASDTTLTDNLFNNGYPVADNIESAEIFHDTNCGGRMHAPTVTTLSAAVTNTSNGEVTITYNISGAAPGYSIHTEFGDNTNFDLQGPAVNTTATHNYYPYGSYEIAVSVKGTDGIPYAYLIPITVSAPATVPVYSLTIDSANTASGLVNFTLDWSNALGDWHHIDFGDGQSFDVNGASGHQSASHVYNPGQNPYMLSFTVKGQDSQNYVASQQVSMPLPTVSLTINSVDPVTGFTMFTAAWTNAPIDSWQRITFGQEDFYVDYQGASDTKVDSHIYPPGTYTMTLTVNCRNGQTYTASQQIVVTGPTATPVPPTVTPAPPSYSLTIDSVDQNSGLTTFTLDWGSALADWHHIDFGDGQAFDVNGGSGHQQATHIYNPGTYTMTFTVKGLDGQNYPSTQQITVIGPPTATPVPQPTLSLTILSVDNATGVVSFQAVWNNALNDWQHMDFGHDGAYVDYQGGSGDHTDSNIIPVGTYTFTLTVKGMDGQNYTASQQVTRS